MLKKLEKYFLPILTALNVSYYTCELDDEIQHGGRDLSKSCSTLSVTIIKQMVVIILQL